MSTRMHTASLHAQGSVLAQLRATANGQGITTISNADLVAGSIYQARTIEYALRNLREAGHIQVRSTPEHGRVIKVN